jgi:hypothetical protein
VARIESALADATLPERTVNRLKRDLSAAHTTLSVAEFVAKHPEVLEAATHGSVHVMQIGPVVLVGIPGELFVEYGLEIKQRVRQNTGRPAMIIGYANDYIGYLITPRAVHTGGYEQAIARVAPSAGRVLTETAMTSVAEFIEPRSP